MTYDSRGCLLWRLGLFGILAVAVVACADAPSACGDGICSEEESIQTCSADCVFDLVVIVEAALYEPLESHLETYLDGLVAEGLKGYVLTFDPAPVDELRALLVEQLERYNIGGAFLVGDLPAAWYEQQAFDVWEEFPMDVYLEDLDAFFSDNDDDGMFDSHTPLGLEIYTSRIMGEVADLQEYFDRVDRFRKEGHLLEPSAFVFIDDGWSGSPSVYGLDDIYTTVQLTYDPSESTLNRYVQQLTGDGAEFVLQKIHSSATYLSFQGEGGGMLYAKQIRAHNFQTSFVHMWDCWAARFIRDSNLGMIYTVENDQGLAVIGSTKKGAVRSIATLHERLALNEPIGEAFRYWYNAYGRTDDEWALGIVVLGDPTLIVWGDVTGLLERQLSSVSVVESLEWSERTLRDHPTPQDLDTFEDYRLAHPEFFGS